MKIKRVYVFNTENKLNLVSKYILLENVTEVALNNFKLFADISQFCWKLYKKFEVDVQCYEKLHDLCDNLPFLPQIVKNWKSRKTLANLHDKTKYAMHIRNLKSTLNYGLVLKKVHKVTNFN